MEPTTALLFSGGRASLVLLHILEPYLDETLVMWCNTGASYESTLKQMDQIRASVPHFFEVKTDQGADIERWGYPTDILPVRNDIQLHGTLLPKLQTTLSCCTKNIYLPLQLALKDKKIKICYVGSGEEDRERDGILLKHPLRTWTPQMVQDYVKKHNIMLPPYYHQGELKSRECVNCTGYLWERRAAIRNLPFYPKEALMGRLQEIADAVHKEQASGYGEILQDVT